MRSWVESVRIRIGKLIHVVSFNVVLGHRRREENDITFASVQATLLKLTASFSSAAVHFLYIIWFSMNATHTYKVIIKLHIMVV